MNRITSMLVAGLFATVAASPFAIAQDRKKEQVHKNTAEQGTVQKKVEKKDRKKDGSGKTKAPAAETRK